MYVCTLVQPLKVYLYSLYPLFLLVIVVTNNNKGYCSSVVALGSLSFYCDVILYFDKYISGRCSCKQWDEDEKHIAILFVCRVPLSFCPFKAN
jgi:hypothetical protein